MQTQTSEIPAHIQDDDATFKALSKRPVLAWPTVALYFLALAIWLTSTTLGIQGQLAYGWVFLFNALGAFIAFTVLHDASHRAVSSHQWVNASFGQLAMLFLTPALAFTMFRFIHMQHHRFTNESVDKDPDYWVSQGPAWLLPFKWSCIDLYYYVYYIPRLSQRSAKEQREFKWTLLSLALIMGTLALMGWLDEYLLYHFLPARGAAFILALAFDYLPHHPHKVDGKQHPYQATNVRVGLEWLMTPVLLYQNYHLVHHLYPLVPFYRYIKVWKARQRTMLENEANMVEALSGKTVASEEYIQKRH